MGGFLHNGFYNRFFQLFQQTAFLRFVKFRKHVAGMLLYPFAHILAAFFFILPLRPFPFRHNVGNVHLPRYLLLHVRTVRYYQTDLPVVFLGKHLFKPGRLMGFHKGRMRLHRSQGFLLPFIRHRLSCFRSPIRLFGFRSFYVLRSFVFRCFSLCLLGLQRFLHRHGITGRQDIGGNHFLSGKNFFRIPEINPFRILQQNIRDIFLPGSWVPAVRCSVFVFFKKDFFLYHGRLRSVRFPFFLKVHKFQFPDLQLRRFMFRLVLLPAFRHVFPLIFRPVFRFFPCGNPLRQIPGLLEKRRNDGLDNRFHGSAFRLELELLIISENLSHAFRQLFLQVQGIVLAKVHGLYLKFFLVLRSGIFRRFRSHGPYPFFAFSAPARVVPGLHVRFIFFLSVVLILRFIVLRRPVVPFVFRIVCFFLYVVIR